MSSVLYTALGVGGATVAGAVLGFVFKKFAARWGDLMLAFAAGIMLAAAIIGLIIPSLEGVHPLTFPLVPIGIFLGAAAVNYLDGTIPRLHKLMGIDLDVSSDRLADVDRVLLFVTAIAIHNLPEGIAAGVGFGSGDFDEAFTIVGGIMLQNIPEGMVIIAPMLSAGISRSRTFLCAVMSGVVEVIGTLLGYFAVSISVSLLPFALAFAGGTMIYVICEEMIPETHDDGNKRIPTYILLAGFVLMLAADFYI